MLRKLFLAGLLFVAALVSASPTPVEAFYGTWDTNCEQSHFWGGRVCYDVSDRTIYVFYGPMGDTVPDVAFSSNSGAYANTVYNRYQGPIGVWAAGEQYWNAATPWEVMSWDATPPDYVGVHHAYYNMSCHDGPQRICIDGGPNGNFRFVSWYANTPGYEFVVAQ